MFQTVNQFNALEKGAPPWEGTALPAAGPMGQGRFLVSLADGGGSDGFLEHSVSSKMFPNFQVFMSAI